MPVAQRTVQGPSHTAVNWDAARCSSSHPQALKVLPLQAIGLSFIPLLISAEMLFAVGGIGAFLARI